MRIRAWRPVLNGAIARDALAAVESIAAEIQRRLGARRFRVDGGAARTRLRLDHSLAAGTAGVAVFYAYLSRTGARRKHEQTALRLLENAGHAVASEKMEPALFGGFSGVAWAAAHLDRTLFDSNGSSTQAVDQALSNYVNRPGWQREYDLVSGLVGLGVYALERLPGRSAGRCLEGVVDRLEETAERRAHGLTWHTPPAQLVPEQRKVYPDGYDNLGVAHGVPGVIYLLGAAWAAGTKRHKVEKLLDGAVRWLLRQKVSGSRGARFSAWVAKDIAAAGCRSAWCYGDPGIAAALLCAARCVGNSKWEERAIEIACEAATREPDRTGVVDASLCHGAAGLGHVFNRLFQATGKARLRRAAQYWFERTLDMRRPGRGVGGFCSLAANDDGTKFWEDDPGILMGASGIGLALLAAATSIEPEWDRILLLSTRNPGSWTSPKESDSFEGGQAL